MEISKNELGLYFVTFNGTLFDDCSNDFTCPGELICNINQTWTATQTLCTCSLSLGKEGIECENVNVWGWILIGISIASFSLAVTCLLVNIYNLIISRVTHSERIPLHSALFTTLLLTTCACSCMALQTAYQIASHFVARTTPVLVGGVIRKESSLVFLNLSTTTLSFIFGVFSALNISLVLIEIADRVRKGSITIYKNVFVYRRFLIGYSLVFGLIAIIFAAVGRAELTFAIAAPAVIFIAISYFLGYLKLSRAYGGSDAPRNGADSEKVERILRNIKMTALGMSLSSFAMIICAILQITLDKLNRPDTSGGAIPGRVFWIFAVTSMFWLTRYCHIQIHGRQRRSSEKRKSGNEKEQMTARIVNDNPMYKENE